MMTRRFSLSKTIPVCVVMLLSCAAVAIAAGKPELVLQYMHAQRAIDVSFSRQPRLLSIDDRMGTIDIWDTGTWTLLRTIKAVPAGSVQGYTAKPAALSPDGKTFAYARGREGIELWDVATGKLRRTLAGSTAPVLTVTWSLDGRRIAVGAASAEVWDVKSGKLVQSIPARGYVAFSPDGRLLGIVDQNYYDPGNHGAQMFNIATGKKVRTFKDESGVFGPIAISPDGKLIATGGEDPKWKPAPLAPDEPPPTEAYYAHEMKVKIWDARTGKLLRMLPGHSSTDGGTHVLQFGPDSRKLLSGGYIFSDLWDVRTGKLLRKFDNFGASALSPDGKMIFTTTQTLNIHNATTGELLKILHPAPIPVAALAFSADSSMLASAGETDMRLWNAKSGKMLWARQGPPPDLHDVHFLPGSRVVSNSIYGSFTWDTVSGKLIAEEKGPTESTSIGNEQRRSLMSPDGSLKVIESGGYLDGTFQVRDISSGQLVCTIPAAIEKWSRALLYEVAFSADGRYFGMVTNRDKPRRSNFLVWDLKTCNKIMDIGYEDKEAISIGLSPDGARTAGIVMDYNSGRTMNLVIWNTKTGAVERSVPIRSNFVRSITFTPDERMVVVTSPCPYEARLYDISTGQEVKSFRSDGTTISAIALSPDGRFAATGDDKGRVRIWNMKDASLVRTMVGFTMPDSYKPSQDWVEWTPHGRYNWSPGASALIRWKVGDKLYPASAFEKELRINHN